MDTNRREFIQTAASGAVVIGLAGAAVAAASSAAPSGAVPAGARKMVVRADDVGHSKVCNIGTFEAVEHGPVTTIAIMLDSPGTEDALERLKAYPWLSLDWHTHMWGSPVTPAARVPTLVEKGGPFDGRFRLDLAQAQDVNEAEAVTELRAQLERCNRILGKVPDSGNAGNPNSPWGRAMQRVNDEYGIVYNYAATPPANEKYLQHIRDAQKRGEEWSKYYSANPGGGKADPRWAGRKIVNLAGTTAFIDLLTDSISSVEKNYDPVLFYTEDRSGILKQPADVISMQAWHPGYVDYYVYRLGERVNRARAQQFVVGRTQDVAALTDPRLRIWIRQNRIELVSVRDAIYGTRDIQNHLRTIGSDLYVA